jgi:predicted heme/steroid binding protein/uncharacterized membrane protein
VDKKFTQEEMAKYNGTEGKPSYVSVDGKVYDVSNSPLWQSGQHMKRHAPGQDLTAEMSAAPHGKEVLDREVVKLLGILVKEEQEEIPAFLAALFQRFPILRRHPHPMMVHFPMAYLIGGALFMVLDVIAPRVAPFEVMAFAMLLLSAFFTPLSIGTGLITWWVNYGGRRMYRVTRKLQLAVLLALMEIVCLVMRIRGPVQGEVTGGVYFALMLAMAVIAVMLGYHGGRLTFPYEGE